MARTPKRTIQEVLDLMTGQTFNTSEFFMNSEEVVFGLRHSLEKEIQNGTKRHVCLHCKQQLKIRGQVGARVIMHFAHLRDSNDCEIKTDGKLSQRQIEIRKYNGAKESDLHFRLKHLIAQFLELNESENKGVSDVKIEKVQKDKIIPATWKKPDVSALYKEQQVVFELQLSTTFLSVIVERQEFYKRNNTFVLWVFSHFETHEDQRKFTQSDIFYSNNQNGFELDERAISLSIEQKDLVLCCHYISLELENGQILENWEKEYVSLSELIFDSDKKQVYYYDSEGERNRINNKLKIDRSRFIAIIHNGTLKDLLHEFSFTTLSKVELAELKALYDEHVRPKKSFDRNSIEFKIVWCLLLHKLDNDQMVDQIADDYDLRKAISAILSLKINKSVGYLFDNLIQVAHSILNSQPEFVSIYKEALAVFPHLGQHDAHKLNRKFASAFLKAPKQRSVDPILIKLFPELTAD